MSVKSKLRALLGDLLITKGDKLLTDRIADRLIILNLGSKDAPEEIGPCIRILSSDTKNAFDIIQRIKPQKDELGIESIHLADNNDRKLKIYQKSYSNSVIIKLQPISWFRSTMELNINKSYLKNEVLGGNSKSEKIVIDFSSPNMAKPFHFGHLKSTILGNFIANLNKYLDNQVVKLNYIGDWGTQYGLLNQGLEEEVENVDLLKLRNESPLRYLLDVYSRASKRGQMDNTFYSEAKNKFLELENGNSEVMEKWRFIRDLSMEELRLSYANIGVEFDVYDYESNYALEAKNLVENRFMGQSFVKRLEDGRAVAEVNKNDKTIEVPIQKSDGASLYITRDICSAINRMDRYRFDQMYYVVGADQEKHFHCLRELLKRLGYDWYDRLHHVKMGKVLGMSSRSGDCVLLADIIKEATERYIESTKNTPTTKLKDDRGIEEVGKHLALTALFVFDMQNGRGTNYTFDWERVMKRSYLNGINLQTCYARLDSVSRRATEIGITPINHLNELDIKAIDCNEGLNLLSCMSELDTGLYNSYWSMSPSHLVRHGLLLCQAINSVTRQLRVINEPNESFARTRLTLYVQAQKQLEFIIKMIGLKPLARV